MDDFNWSAFAIVLIVFLVYSWFPPFINWIRGTTDDQESNDG